jgi:hypothetical protein
MKRKLKPIEPMSEEFKAAVRQMRQEYDLYDIQELVDALLSDIEFQGWVWQAWNARKEESDDE